MKKVMITGLVTLMITSCASTKNEQFATEGHPSRPAKVANISKKEEVKNQTSVTSSQTLHKSEIRHKEGWIHPAAR